MEQGSENRRPDVILFVNGIPVCIIELKNPTKVDATVYDAHTQICTRYMRDIPNLMKYCVLAIISDAAKTELGTPFTPFEYFYEWKKVENEDQAGKGLDTLKTLVKGALSPERILEILRDYVYFPDPTDEDDTTAAIHSSLPQESCVITSSIIFAQWVVMVRVVHILVLQVAARPIPCSSFPVSWLCAANRSWAVLPSSLL